MSKPLTTGLVGGGEGRQPSSRAGRSGWAGSACSFGAHAACLAALLLFVPPGAPVVGPEHVEIPVEVVVLPSHDAAGEPDSAPDTAPDPAPSDAPRADLPVPVPDAAPPPPAAEAPSEPDPPSPPEPHKSAELPPPEPMERAPIEIPAQPEGMVPPRAKPAGAPRPADPASAERAAEARRHAVEARKRRAERDTRLREEERREQEAERRAAAAEKRREAEARRQAAERGEARRRAARVAAERPGSAGAPARPASASSADIAAYRGQVIAHLSRFKHYPEGARAREAEGMPGIAFVLDGSGRVAGASLTRSSGQPDLDAEAVAMVRRAVPFPAPPAGAPRSFSTSIGFRLR